MRRPMPSPRGTNRAGLFLSSGSRAAAAYDAMPDDVDPAGIIEFLDGKIDDDDLATVKKMLGMEDASPTPGASDARRGRHIVKPPQYASDAFPNRNRLKG